MIVKWIALFLSSFLYLYGFSQEKKQHELDKVFKILVLNPGVSYEHPVAVSQSLYFNVFSTSLTELSYGSANGFVIDFMFDPALSIQYRYYYNGARRVSKGKRTEMNSQNYLSGIVTSIFSKRAMTSDYYVENDRRPVSTAGVAWGIQRNYKSHFSLDFYLGLGYSFAKDKVYISSQKTTINSSTFGLIGQLSIGFWLNNK